ncbi:MAG TPA: hypothetical protein VNX18_07540 [Bryobacteraceae bacterium]|jgi:hypothetical protein|nr:hypothetical protein [Bryobacteraceae bacterium]
MYRTAQAALFCLCFVSVLSAQDKTSIEESRGIRSVSPQLLKYAASAQERNAIKLKPADATTILALSVFDAITLTGALQPGQGLTLPSIQDWTGTDHIAVAIQCPQASSVQNLQIGVQWIVPVSIATLYTLTDVILGSNFPLSNQGGAVVPTYGNQLQLILFNAGSTPISCSQVTIAAKVH